ncbi:MAG: DUF3990 domain-containing protein [Azoarcus sp.]|jgi:hypothetical protein|nr:DUF3990 domain-containing protein [Azoarcus sp.]
MRVYHGSDILIEEIDLTKSGNFKDFGRGFYVTNIRKHAHSRALDIVMMPNFLAGAASCSPRMEIGCYKEEKIQKIGKFIIHK